MERKTKCEFIVTFAPFAAELPPPDGKKWFDTHPPTKTRESHRLKRIRCDDEQVIADETADAIVDSNQPDSDLSCKDAHAHGL
jgi:hypothetical protein